MAEYFTGRFQGRIPITDKDINQAWVIEDGSSADIIAILLTALFGGADWQVKNKYEDMPHCNYIVYR